MASGIIRISSIQRVFLLRDNSGTMQRVRLNMANTVGFEPDIAEIEYEGDGGTTIIPRASGFTGEITCDAFDLTALNTIFGKTPITAGLPVGETSRTYWMTDGDAGGISCGVEAVATGIDDATGNSVYVGIVAPRGVLSTLTPPELVNLDKAPMTLQFSARATAVDIAGDALVSIGAGVECYYYLSIYSALPAAG